VPLLRNYGIHRKDGNLGSWSPLPDVAYNSVQGGVVTKIAASRMVQQRYFVV
jgi:hypothetical protein